MGVEMVEKKVSKRGPKPQEKASKRVTIRNPTALAELKRLQDVDNFDFNTAFDRLFQDMLCVWAKSKKDGVRS